MLRKKKSTDLKLYVSKNIFKNMGVDDCKCFFLWNLTRCLCKCMFKINIKSKQTMNRKKTNRMKEINNYVTIHKTVVNTIVLNVFQRKIYPERSAMISRRISLAFTIKHRWTVFMVSKFNSKVS